MLLRGWLFALILLVCLQGCLAQSPGVRNGHNMVYYGPAHAIILFGGATEAKVCGDTWGYARGRWKKIADSGPSPRTFPCMAAAGDYIVLFGGNAVLFGNDKNPVHYLDDTWLFRDGHWKQIITSPHPGPRAEAAMAYDPRRKKIVLFGGRQAGDKWVAGDTWEFDGEKWEQVQKDGPTPRSGAVMVYDPMHKQVVMFGGNPVIAKEKDYNGPMWSWEGNVWNRMGSDVPLIFNSCMAYNPLGNYILRFGGWDGGKRVSDTWIFKDKAWKKLSLENVPAARNHSIMVYDLESSAFFLYGGHDGENVFGDMWCFKKGKWGLTHAEPPRKHLENGH